MSDRYGTFLRSLSSLGTKLKPVPYSCQVIIPYVGKYYPALSTVNILVCLAVFSQELKGIFKCLLDMGVVPYRYCLLKGTSIVTVSTIYVGTVPSVLLSSVLV
jgi:hypothetical protein